MTQAISDALVPYGTIVQRDAAIAAALASYSDTAAMNAAIAARLATIDLSPYWTIAQVQAAITAALVPVTLSNGQSWGGGPTFNLLRGSDVLRNLSVAGALTASFQNLDDTILIESDSYARSETYTQLETGAAITAAVDALNLGGNAPNVSKASSMKEACTAINHFMRHRFPNGTWTSIAVLLNPRIGLHRDMQNMVGELNHAITLGNFIGGRVWIEDDEGTSIEKLSKNGKVRKLKGSWFEIHDQPMSFNARRFHKIEQHEGHMWALAAYTPQSFRRCSDEVCLELKELGFPLQAKT